MAALSLVSPATLSTCILLATLVLFASERVRHDLVALIALFASVVTGLIRPGEAFAGFSDPAVLAVAGVLVVGRAVELSGAASAIAKFAIPAKAGFAARLAGLLVIAALLSAFMNNIAALVITMPIASEIARDSRLPPAATLMPLAFATILGGMTTLIGTPANLILSSVREQELGEPFGFFSMTTVGVAVTGAGLLYLALIGWRLLPIRTRTGRQPRDPWRVFELAIPHDGTMPASALLRIAGARMLAAFRSADRLATGAIQHAGDRLLILSRANPWDVAQATGLDAVTRRNEADDAVTARVAVAHGSPLIGAGYDEVRTRSQEQLEVVAVGPRVARERKPLVRMRIRAGDQLYVRGRKDDIAHFIAGARLLEIDRLDPMPVNRIKAAAIVGIFAAAIVCIVAFRLSPALAFVGAAAMLAGTRLIPTEDVYRSIDWSVLVLLGTMIPVGQSFEESGAAALAAHWLGGVLAGQPVFLVFVALCSVTLLLSIFLNNVATAIIMGPMAIAVAHLLGVNPDAALLAVLIGASSDFLTPIGHQNNLLVMGPGGYRFTDYARMGAPLVIVVVVISAAVLAFSA
ncbi:SLC13 family permease [Sphingobium phenoxybenzoativorans]|uniref:SLC13 family permease n=1 Tax=Sphingobium phenoxybenzoativorans TaxID=1592790 RepID=A0A975Q1R6_9SPHN|nr:SLC13 family permease [Sphingobium phenoxybenzoativorans]QUT06084.1 SLC13 family permease [Sphingobium phenoxybenzoativorans]